MSADTHDTDGVLDGFVAESLERHATALYPEPHPAREDAWRRIERRRRTARLRSRVIWPAMAAAAVVALVVVSVAFARQDPVVKIEPGGTPHPTAEESRPVGSTSAEPNPTGSVDGAVAPGSGGDAAATTVTVAPGPGNGPSPTAPAPGEVPPGPTVNSLATLTIPSAVCAANDYTDLQPNLAPLGTDVTAQVPYPVPPGAAPGFSRQPVGLRFGTVVPGDVTGDGVDDSLVVVKCAFGAGMTDMYWARVVVVDGTAPAPVAGPALVASGAPLEEDGVPTADGSGTESVGHHGLYESLVGLRIDHGEIVASWVQTANVVIPRVNQWSRRVESRHRLQGGSFVAAGPVSVQPWVKDPYGAVQPFGPTSW